MGTVKHGAAIALALMCVATLTAAKKKNPSAPMPDGFILGRHTFIDIGPPFDFYEVLRVSGDGAGTTVERIVVTPRGDPCTQPATVEVAKAMLPASIAEVLGGSNPCSIPEKALRKELKRCKHCVVFSPPCQYD